MTGNSKIFSTSIANISFHSCIKNHASVFELTKETTCSCQVQGFFMSVSILQIAVFPSVTVGKGRPYK